MNIVIEGISGVGKTSVIKELEKKLKNENLETTIVGDLEYDTPIKEVLLKMVSEAPLMNSEKKFNTSIYESLLLAANHHYVQEKLRNTNDICIYDRDFLSLLVYQKFLIKIEYDNWEEIYEAYKKIVLLNLKKIDLLIYIHTPLEIAIERTEKRDGRIFSDEDVKLLKNFIKEYDELLNELKITGDVIKIDGTKDIIYNVDKTYEKILKK